MKKELTARVGADGMLTLTVPLGRQDANKTVRVVVETVEGIGTPTTPFRSRCVALPLEDAAAEEHAKVRADHAAKGAPIDANALLNAAIALANGLTLVTHNTAEFQRVVGLTLDDWQI